MGTREPLIPRHAPAGRSPAGVAGSVGLHAVLLFALLLAVPKPAPPPPRERQVSVELLDPGQFEAVMGQFASSLPPPRIPEALGLPDTPPDIISFPADLPPPPRSGETIVPERLLSAATLADPRSAAALAALPQLAADERVVQLCAVEALAQIAALDADYAPDLLSAYSTEAVRATPGGIDAGGAAFRSDGRWFALAFRCGVSPGSDIVTAFEFRIGEEIPHQDWALLHLAEGSDPHGH